MAFVKLAIDFLLNLLEKYFIFALGDVIERGAGVKDNVVHTSAQRLITNFGIKQSHLPMGFGVDVHPEDAVLLVGRC